MSTAERVGLAEEVRGEFGLGATLAVLELPRSTWYYHQRSERQSYEEVIYTDFTELVYAGGRAKAYLVPFLDPMIDLHVLSHHRLPQNILRTSDCWLMSRIASNLTSG